MIGRKSCALVFGGCLRRSILLRSIALLSTRSLSKLQHVWVLTLHVFLCSYFGWITCLAQSMPGAVQGAPQWLTLLALLTDCGFRYLQDSSRSRPLPIAPVAFSCAPTVCALGSEDRRAIVTLEQSLATQCQRGPVVESGTNWWPVIVSASIPVVQWCGWLLQGLVNNGCGSCRRREPAAILAARARARALQG